MDERIGYVLKMAQTALRARMDEALDAHGITVPQYAALSALEKNPGISNAELARLSFVKPQTMIRIVTHLEAVGLAARKPHPAHGRILQTMLTVEGRKLVAACHGIVDAVQDRMLGSISPEEQQVLAELLKRCFDSLT